MEIPSCPVLHPTEAQFADFYNYIHHLDRTYKKEYGMVKIVPPPQWKPQAKDYHKRLQNLWVKNPIEQNVQGRGGFYESKNIIQPKMTLKVYRKRAEKESNKVESLSTTQKQNMFWKTITYSPPVYGADLTGSLMDENAGSWNLNGLNSLLRYALTARVKGVTEPYCYIGSWKAFFSWHKEDLDLSALNYIHEGASKLWYSLARDDAELLEAEAREYFKGPASQCSQFLRHKTFLINPEVLLKRHPNIKLTKVQHKAGEIMMVFGGAYHTGFNLGFNIAEAVNYGTMDWLGELPTVKFCKCFRKSVKGQIESILYNLENSSIYEQLKENDLFKNLQYYVFQNQMIEEGNVQSQLSKVKPQESVRAQKQEKEKVHTSQPLREKKHSKEVPKTSKTTKIKKSPKKSSNSHKTKPSRRPSSSSKKSKSKHSNSRKTGGQKQNLMLNDEEVQVLIQV